MLAPHLVSRLTLSGLLALGLCSPALAQEAVTATAVPDTAQKLQGGVTISVPDAFGSCVVDLVQTAEKQNEDFTRYSEAVDHYSTLGRRVRHRAGDALNYTLMYKGISASSEAGDVILGEKEKLKSLASAQYLRQKTHDDLQLKVLSGVMQLAMAMGNGDELDRNTQFKQGQDELTKLVGKEQTDRTIAVLKSMRDHEALQAKTISKPIWSVSQTQKRIQSAVQAAALADPIVKEIETDVHKYNHHGNATLVGHRLVRVALSTVSLAPSLVGPAAQALLFGFLAVSGGTEQEKLLSELYLDKRLSSRARLLSEEAHLAFENYQLAAMTNNKLLMSCSEQIVTRMTSGDTAAKLLNAGEYREPQKTE